MKNKIFICTITPKLVEKTIWHDGEPESNDQRRAATRDWSETFTVRTGSTVECQEAEIDPDYLHEFNSGIQSIKDEFKSKLVKFYEGLVFRDEFPCVWMSDIISFKPVVKAGGLTASFEVDADKEFEDYFDNNLHAGTPRHAEFCFIVHYGIRGQYVTKARECNYCEFDVSSESYDIATDFQDEIEPALCLAEELCEAMGMNIDGRYSHLS